MEKLILSLALSVCCLSWQSVNAQTQKTNPYKWGIETELVAPFLPEVGIITFKATRTIYQSRTKSAHGDLLLGMYIRPNVNHDIVEKINEYLVTVGYRHYFFKGLHLEGQLDGGYAWGTENKIDGKDYSNFALLGEINAGYKFGIPSKRSTNLYILPQFGVLQGLSTNIGPRGGQSDTFIQGKLMVGLNF